jgi:hypothetical protein
MPPPSGPQEAFPDRLSSPRPDTAITRPICPLPRGRYPQCHDTKRVASGIFVRPSRIALRESFRRPRSAAAARKSVRPSSAPRERVPTLYSSFHLPPDHDLQDPRRQQAHNSHYTHGSTDPIEPISTWSPATHQEQRQPATQHGESHAMYGHNSQQVRPDPADAEYHRNMSHQPDGCHRYGQHGASRKTRLASKPAESGTWPP